MNYRILRFYPSAYSEAVYFALDQIKDLLDRSYHEMALAFNELGITYGKDFSSSMTVLGNETVDLPYDVFFLQEAWAKEHGITFSLDQWQTEIAEAQIAFYKPDVILFQGNGLFSSERCSKIRDDYKFIRLLACHNGYPVDPSALGPYDVLLVAAPMLIKHYASIPPKVCLVYHSFNASVLVSIPPKPIGIRNEFIGFAGTSGDSEFHARRFWYLVALSTMHKIRYRVVEHRSEAKQTYWESLRTSLKASCIAAQIQFIPKRFDKSVQTRPIEHPLTTYTKRLHQIHHSACFGRSLISFLNDCKISFNCHADVAHGQVGNMRMFESTGIGCCLLNDMGSNISDLFVPDEEIVTYGSLPELLDKTRSLSRDEELVESIARRGHERTLRDHTVQKRCEQIHQIFCDHLGA